jgi:hypothetical protein
MNSLIIFHIVLQDSESVGAGGALGGCGAGGR